jgi:3,4-dihydroxy 2-butanone 4-phosphate synthase
MPGPTVIVRMKEDNVCVTAPYRSGAGLFAQGMNSGCEVAVLRRYRQPLKGYGMKISKIEDAIAVLARGGMIVAVDDEDRENEGDIIVASDSVTSETIAFMMKHARGLICIAMEGERLDALDIPLMVPRNTEFHKTAFTVSVDYLSGTTTGISADDRAATVRALVDSGSRPADFARPGHIFPLRAHPAGVRGRPGHTEAAVDLARLAGKSASGVICEVANDDGTMARLPELLVFADIHQLPLITIKDLIAFVEAQAAVGAAQAA